MTDEHRPAELRWVFRPAATRPDHVRALGGSVVHGTGPAKSDGAAEITLADGTRLRATAAEIVAE